MFAVDVQASNVKIAGVRQPFEATRSRQMTGRTPAGTEGAARPRTRGIWPVRHERGI